MNASKKLVNNKPYKLKKYIKSYASLRGILRLLSYGCYTRNDFQLFGISGRKYDDDTRRIRAFLSEDNLNKCITDRKVRLTFNTDCYHNSMNFLINSFQIKTISADFCQCTLESLQLFHTPKKAYSFTEFINEMLYIDKDESFFRRFLDELLNSGYLIRFPRKNTFFYTLSPDYFNNLTIDELKQLFYAVAFASNTALLSVPGYYLLDTIKEYLLYQHHEIFLPHDIYQFKNNVLTRMIDDDIINNILTCIKEQQDLLITTHDFSIIPQNTTKLKTFLAKPLKIETEYTYNRQYLIAQTPTNELRRIRIDKIDQVTIMKPTIKRKPFPRLKLQVIQLQFKCPTQEQPLLRKYLKQSLPSTTSYESISDGFIVTIKHHDPLALVPLIRTFHPYAKIIKSPNDKLLTRVKNDITEVLKNYGVIS